MVPESRARPTGITTRESMTDAISLPGDDTIHLPVSPRQTVAHYRITAKLGEGGMGEVWRATDTKLGRDVAIKILPDSFAQDPDRMARFTREAQVLASLNHPNIAAIYGVEERALIMELVEGPTVAERIAQGPIPLEEALPIARQIAEALEYAPTKPSSIAISSRPTSKSLPRAAPKCWISAWRKRSPPKRAEPIRTLHLP